MPSNYQPRSKTRRVGRWKISDNRIAWARVAPVLVSIMRYTEEEMRLAEDVPPDEDYETGDTYRLLISLPNMRRPITINLTALTFEELEAFEKLVNLAITISKPVVQERDRKAAEASANGDDSFSRIYRPVPQFIIREGSFGEDAKSVLDGLAYAPEGLPSNRDPNGGVRASRAELADELSEDSEAEDYGPTPD